MNYLVSKCCWKFHVHAMVCTKPNIAQVMGVVNHSMVNLGQSHWIVMKHIFHYLKVTMKFSMCFKKNIKDVNHS